MPPCALDSPTSDLSHGRRQRPGFMASEGASRISPELRRGSAPAWRSVSSLLVLWLASIGVAAPHTFTFTPTHDTGDIHSVAVAGTFNGWSRHASPLQQGDDGLWSATLDLPDGVHHYKLVVNGDRWLNDPHSDKELEEPDGHGGVNSAVLIGLDGRKLPAPQPNHINTDGVIHNPDRDARIVSREHVLLKLRVRQGDAQSVEASTNYNPMGPMFTVPLQRLGTRHGFDEFAALIPSSGTKVSYSFIVRDGEARHELLDKQGSHFVLMLDDPAFATPDWAKHAVWYQVFPERFRNGDTSNDPPRSLPWTSDWWAAHIEHGEAAGPQNFYRGKGNVWHRKYGGDLQGMIEALPYLRRLGVNAIYLNPMFEAESQHKYDTGDFRHIDDNFGFAGELAELATSGVETDDPDTWTWTKTDLLFLRFVAEAHRQGFHVILDGVFNHVGRPHYAFQDVLNLGRDSRYAEWFEIIDWGDPANWGKPETYGKEGGLRWRAWDGDNGWLPAFRKDGHRGLADGPREHIFAITRRWMAPANLPDEFFAQLRAEYGDEVNYRIDGWRLDVPGDIPHPFWIEWRQVVKSSNPDAYITGEIWGWAHPWLKGDQFDAVMNYQFAVPAQAFFVNQRDALTPTQFARRLHNLAYTYPLQVSLVNQNLYDSHDTDRLASMFVNPDRPYDGANRLQDNGPDYNPRKPTEVERKRKLQAAVLQMTYLGAPMIYYGTEAGMWSPDDPSNRMPMTWAELTFDDPQVKFDPAVFASFQRAIAVRHALAPLRLGLYRTVATDDPAGVLVFARDLVEESVYVVVNRSDSPRTVLVSVADAQAQPWYDLMSPSVVALQEGEDRPAVTLRGNARSIGANATGLVVKVEPWGTAVLARRDALQ